MPAVLKMNKLFIQTLLPNLECCQCSNRLCWKLPKRPLLNTSLKNIRSCTKWVWLCNFLDSSMFPMATMKLCHALGHFSSQAHTAQLPFNSSSGWNLDLYVTLVTGIPAEGHQGVRARWESNTIPVSSWGEQPAEQDRGTHRGTDLLHSFEAHGVDSLTVQLNTPEEGKEAALCQTPYYERLSAAATTESTFFSTYRFLSLQKQIAQTPSKTITHTSSYASAAQLQEHVANNVVSSAPKCNLAEIKLPNF